MGAEQRWELKDVSAFFFSFQAKYFVISDTWIMFLCLQRSNNCILSAFRTSCSTYQDGTCVWLLVTSFPLWLCATPRTDTSTGPSSKCAKRYLKHVYFVCRSILGQEYSIIYAVFFFFFRSVTSLNFNLFLYLEELNNCCWNVWTYFRRNHHVPLLQGSQQFLQQLRCTLDKCLFFMFYTS